jgi:hypothetical protein
MKTVLLHLKSSSPYSQSRFHNTPKLEKELHDDYEKRTWMEKGHWNASGHMFIPPTAICSSIQEAAKYLSLQIPGQGKANYTKNFAAGVMVVDSLQLPVTRETVRQNWVFCNADGKKGSGTRVLRAFPVCDQWEGDIQVEILDDIITRPVFEQVLFAAGNLIGIGQFRPRNGGYFGRYVGKVLKWTERNSV